MSHKLLICFLAICWTQSIRAQTIPEERIATLGLSLPNLPKQTSNSYSNLVRSGNLIFLSGKGPLGEGGKYITGRAGAEVSLDTAITAARLCALHQLAVLKKELGALSRIKKIVKVGGFVNSSPDFYDQSKVMDGFSDLLISILGDKGKHARTAVSAVSLPFNWTVEVDAIVEIFP
ncbi:RidA family protein [Pedobacter panaciterrae]|uniref:RidA family protein n=1 Tax=Pedobacter panaciterrae TaxID=363849 RepID=UPI002597D9FE|nr:RidA family protein [uncultured Pedobacter sp.]